MRNYSKVLKIAPAFLLAGTMLQAQTQDSVKTADIEQVVLIGYGAKKKSDLKPLSNRIKQLEKALEKANVMIYGLNAMIDYAEKELKVPVRKKPGTKQ